MKDNKDKNCEHEEYDESCFHCKEIADFCFYNENEGTNAPIDIETSEGWSEMRAYFDKYQDYDSSDLEYEIEADK
jgi:hypothetical protein